MKLIITQLHKLIADVLKTATSRDRLKMLFHIPFYSNTFYLVVNYGISAPLGFVFWIIAGRIFSPEDVGLASAAISAIVLVAGFANLGLGVGLVRFLPHSGENGNSMINTVFTAGTLTSIVAAFIFIGGLGFWSPALLFIRQNLVYLVAFVLFTTANTLTVLVRMAFVAERRTGFILVQDLIGSLLKLILVVVLVTYLNSFTIFASWGISLWAAILLSIFLFLPRAQSGYRPFFAVNKKVIGDIIPFSFANYLSSFFWTAPATILPIMVVNLLGAEPNAYFYIAWTIGAALTAIISAITTSLFAEGSYDEESLGLNLGRALKVILLIIVPAVILVLAIAPQLLLLVGGSYSENATTLLRILAIATLPIAINSIYLAIKRVEKKLKILVVLPAFVAITTLGLSYLLLPRLGINGVGIAWLTTQGATALVVVASWLKGRQAFRQLNIIPFPNRTKP